MARGTYLLKFVFYLFLVSPLSKSTEIADYVQGHGFDVKMVLMCHTLLCDHFILK